MEHHAARSITQVAMRPDPCNLKTRGTGVLEDDGWRESCVEEVMDWLWPRGCPIWDKGGENRREIKGGSAFSVEKEERLKGLLLDYQHLLIGVK